MAESQSECFMREYRNFFYIPAPTNGGAPYIVDPMLVDGEFYVSPLEYCSSLSKEGWELDTGFGTKFVNGECVEIQFVLSRKVFTTEA